MNIVHACDRSKWEAFSYTGANPAAGADYFFSPTEAAEYEIALISFLLTTSVAAANRYISIQYGGQVVNFSTPIPASNACQISFERGLGIETGNAALVLVRTSIPVGLIGLYSSSLVIHVTNMQAADTLTNIKFQLMLYRYVPTLIV